MDSEERLRLLAAADLTYSEVGASADYPLPEGYHQVHRRAELGHGLAVFERAATIVNSWQLHRLSGFTVLASASPVELDAVAFMTLGWGLATIEVPVRVVEVIAEPRARGFAYGTLPGHPESGEERFVIELDDDERVIFLIRAFSRPANLLTRVSGPLGHWGQRLATDRYIRVLTKAANDTAT